MEKKQVKISLGTFIVGIIAIILVVAVVIMGIQISNQNKALEESQIAMANKEKELQQDKISKNNESATSSNTNNKTQTLDINSNLIQKLYKIPLKCNDFGYYKDDKYYLRGFYKDNPATYQNLSNLEKTIAILKNVNENEVEVSKMTDIKASEKYNLPSEYIYKDNEYPNEFRFYNSNLISDTAKKIYGNNYKNDIRFDTIDSGYGSAYVYVDGGFVKLDYPGGGFGLNKYAESKIIKAEQNDDEIYIYDKYMFIEDVLGLEDNDIVENYYLTSDMTQKIATVYINYGTVNTYTIKNTNGITELTYTEKANRQDGLENQYREQYFNKYIDNLHTYKHTFKKASDGTYYWVSTEIFNQ